MRAGVSLSSPICTLFCPFQLFSSAHPSDQQQPTTICLTANSQATARTRSQPFTDLDTSLLCSSSQQISLRLSLVHHASASEGLLSDFPDLPALLLDPLLLQLQFFIPAGFSVAIEKMSLKFIYNRTANVL